jgi:hypothetical protein
MHQLVFGVFFIIYLCKKSIHAKNSHRGARGYGEYPYWFSKAIDLQVDLIELDVHLSADGE